MKQLQQNKKIDRAAGLVRRSANVEGKVHDDDDDDGRWAWRRGGAGRRETSRCLFDSKGLMIYHNLKLVVHLKIKDPIFCHGLHALSDIT